MFNVLQVAGFSFCEAVFTRPEPPDPAGPARKPALPSVRAERAGPAAFLRHVNQVMEA
jgi:hypothetical protein